MVIFNYFKDLGQVVHLWNFLVFFEHNILAWNGSFLIGSNFSVTISRIIDFSYHSKLAYGIS